MDYDHRFILNGNNDDKLVITISDDMVEMEVRVNDDAAERISMDVDNWITAIMHGDF